MSKNFAVILLLLTLVSCNNKEKIDKIEFSPYRWAYWPYPPDSTTKFTVKLFDFYSIEKTGKCHYMCEGADKRMHFYEFNLNKELLADIFSSINGIKSDTIIGNNLDRFLLNKQCLHMYDGPSYKCVVYKGRNILHITFTEEPFQPFQKLYSIVQSISNNSEILNDSIDLIVAKNKLTRFILNSTEFLIPPPPPASENEQIIYVAPVVGDTIN